MIIYVSAKFNAEKKQRNDFVKGKMESIVRTNILEKMLFMNLFSTKLVPNSGVTPRL